MELLWEGRRVTTVDRELTEAEIVRYRTAGRIVRRRFRTVRRWLP